MLRRELNDAQWDRIKDLVPGKETDCGSTGRDNRLFVDAVLWIARTSSPWRDLPDAFGKWNSVYVRFSRWTKKGNWESLFKALADDPDFECLILDSIIVRAHQHAAGAKWGREIRPSDARAAAGSPGTGHAAAVRPQSHSGSNIPCPAQDWIIGDPPANDDSLDGRRAGGIRQGRPQDIGRRAANHRPLALEHLTEGIGGKVMQGGALYPAQHGNRGFDFRRGQRQPPWQDRYLINKGKKLIGDGHDKPGGYKRLCRC